MKIIKNYFLVVLIIVLIFYNLSPSYSAEIVLDDQNPIQFIYPNSNQLAKIDLRFYLEEKSQGLTFGQYIGVAFPNNLGPELSFDKGSIPKFNCILTETHSGKTFKLTAEKSGVSEPSYIYCKLDDRINKTLKTGPKSFFKFTIEFTGIKIYSTNFIRNFMIFTSTSNDANKIIIDQSMQLGTLMIYSSWEDSKTKPFELISSNIFEGNNALTNIYPYMSFDIALSLKSNIFISSSEINLMIKFPNDLVSSAQSVTSTSDTNNQALKGTLKISSFSNNFMIIDGIDDNFVPNKQINLSLKGFTALDKNLISAKPLEIFIFYKNSYSVLSYDKTSDNFLKITKSKLRLSANHPESWDIWRNALWPMSFKITNGPNALTKGGFIVLQHSNALDGEIKWNFVASTCDFSESENLNNALGKRPVCYPLRTDFEYANSSASFYPGSAVFFKINSITANQVINLIVWGSADNCGGNKLDNLSSAIKPNFAFRQFNYKVSIYSSINQFETNENRFIGSNVSLLAESDEITMANKCYNNIISGVLVGSNPPADGSSGVGRVFDNNKFLQENIWYKSTDANKKAQKDINLFREFYNFQLSLETTSSLPCDTCHLRDITNNSNKFNTAFIYGTKSVNTVNSYFSVRIPFLHYTKEVNGSKIAVNKSIPAEYLPINFAYSENKNNPGNFPGRLQFLFSKKWFIVGNNPSCYVSWGMYSPDVSSINKDKNLIVDDSDGTSTGNKNWITSNTQNKQAWLDTLNSCIIANPSCNNIKILSKHHTGMVNTNNQFNTFSDVATNLFENSKNDDFFTFYVYYYSSCVKWASLPTIKSLYTYIDFQAQWLYSEDESKIGTPNRNLRLIKLFPEAGVFNDNITDDLKFLSTNKSPTRPTQANDKTYYLHYALGSGANQTGICLIEISGKSIMDIMTKTTTHLGIWIGFGVILETDYNDLASNYPITPLNPLNNSSFGFQSAYFLNSQDSLMHEFFYVDSSGNPQYLFKQNNSGVSNTSIIRSMLMNYAKTGYSDSPTLYDFSPRNAADHKKNIYNNFSSYYFLMGSFLLISQNKEIPMINSVGQETQLRNLLIPIYCPINNKKIKYGNGLPTLYISTINMTAYDNISNIEKIMSVNLNNSKANDDKALYTVILSSVFSSSPELYKDYTSIPEPVDTFTIKSSASDFEKNLINIRWASYTTSSPENFDSYLYLYLGTKNINNANEGKCTGHIFLLHNSIDVNLSILKTSFPGMISYYPKSKNFFFLGKEFNHLISIGLQDQSYPANNNIVTTQNAFITETSPMYIIGVKRPVISYYYVNDKFTHAYDKIGYFCSDIKLKENYTNYLFNADSSIKTFLVDYNFPSQEPNKFIINISSDKSEAIYRNDVAANIRISGTTPGNIYLPAGSSINFSLLGSVLNTSSICGLSDSENIASECLFSNGTVSCLTPRSLNNFSICCYNVSFLGIITSDLIVLNSFNVSVPASPFNFSNYYTEKIFNELNPTRFTWDTNHSSAEDLISFFSASITNVQYSHVVQDSGIGKVNFSVALPREPTRNMAITFYADLSSLYIPNSNPRCNASFGLGLGYTRENSGDILIDNCNVSNLGTSINAIRITTKNIIYKCGLNFSKILNVFIWPVLTTNFSTTPFNSLSFRILMNLNNEYTNSIAMNTFSFTIKDTQTYSAKPLIMNKWDSLCPVVTIDPRIPGEFADYVFEIDIDSYRLNLGNNTPNEMSIFFPFNYYGSNFDNINCYNFESNHNLNCSFNTDGVQNIRLPANLKVGSGKKLKIKITGIMNPSIDSNTSIHFPCTLNRTDFASNTRINLITGSGKLNGPVNLPSIIGNIGNLRYLIVKNSISDLNPRNISTLILRVGFDLIGNLNVLPIKIDNNPRIIINLPAEYKLAWFDNSRLTANIDEYNSDDKNNITKTDSFTSKFILQSGNKLTIILDKDSYTFKVNFQFWEISINNLFNPPEDSSEDFLPLSLGTRLTNVIFTNSDFSSVFKTHTNTNNFISKSFENPIDPWLTNYKGFLFNFDNKKWVIDIGSKNKPNFISVRAGRYITSHFILRNNANLITQSNVISLLDSTFKLFQQSYSVNTGSSDSTAFMIGAPCGSKLGNYLLYFKSTDSINFAPLSPVIVSLTNDIRGNINYLNPPTIPKAGSTIIYFYISEPNFDELNLDFVNDENHKNDPTAEISKVIIPSGTVTESSKNSSIFGLFKIKNNQVLKAQVFKLSNPNACYSWIQKSLTIYISGDLTIFPKNLAFSQSFKYYNYENDPKLPGKNAIKFSFIPPIVPSYFSCALVCLDSIFPADDDIRNSKGVESPLLQFYKTMILKSSPFDFIFDNLVRGQKYKLRCLIESIEADKTNRNSVGFVMDSYKKDDGTTVPIQTLTQIKSQCVQYIFSGKPTETLKNVMMNYCQSIFMLSGNWNENGCIVCTDSSLSYLPSGFSLPKSLNCAEMNKKAKIREEENYFNSNFRILESIQKIEDFKEKNIYNKFLAEDKFGLERMLQTNSTTNFTSKNVNIENYNINISLVSQTSSVIDETYYTYSICPVPYQICPSDITGAKNYNDYFNTLINQFNSDDLIRKNANNTDSSLSLYKTLIVKDEVKPNLSSMNFTITYKNISGLIKWKSSYSNALNCYWLIDDYNVEKDADTILQCIDYSYCGNFRVTMVPSISSTNLKFLQPLDEDYNYGLFIVCMNDVPYASLESDVLKVKLIIKSHDGSGNAQLDDNEDYNNDNIGIFLKFDYLLIILIVLLF